MLPVPRAQPKGKREAKIEKTQPLLVAVQRQESVRITRRRKRRRKRKRRRRNLCYDFYKNKNS
jgi:hypothetical protein